MSAALELLAKRLWPQNEPSTLLAQRALVVARYLYALARDLAAGELTLRAMSLVYTTMLAIVPTLAIAFATAKGLDMDQQIGPLLDRLLPIGSEADEIKENIVGFVDNVSGTILSSVGIPLLLFTVVSMAQKVEGSFNFVWRVDRPRGFARRFGDYLSVILVGGLVAVISMALIASLRSATIVEELTQNTTFGGSILFAFGTIPYLMAAFAFTFLYMFIPNARVKLKAAAVGGIAGGLLWTALGALFAEVVVISSSRLHEIYSGFAILFVLMFWIYLSWLILLLGSQLAFYVQQPIHLRHGLRTEPIDHSARERLALDVMFLVACDYARPGHGWTNESLGAKLRVPRNALDPVMAALTNAGLLARASEQRLIPARDPHRIALGDILASVRGKQRNAPTKDAESTEPIGEIADRIDAAIAAELGDGTLGELVDAHLTDAD
ncbi:MAG: YihY/virulence factor BrkB family protein [Gammaproteobacteria bacterium]|nr:YihY/virulence factor BrkB family protein [Gammaproteobacteria bacterium]